MNDAPNTWIYLLFLAPILPVVLLTLVDTVLATRTPSGAAASV